MTQLLQIRSDNPQPRAIAAAAQVLRADGLVAYPTDSCYALGARMESKQALERMRAVRGINERHHLTLMCRDLADFGRYAQLDNRQFRLIKSIAPGSYTFILAATHELPRRVAHAGRRTIGVRISDHPIVQALLGALDEPLLSSTLMLPGETTPLDDASEIHARVGHALDLIIDGGSCGTEPSTVLDLSHGDVRLVRAGRGPLERIAIVAG